MQKNIIKFLKDKIPTILLFSVFCIQQSTADMFVKDYAVLAKLGEIFNNANDQLARLDEVSVNVNNASNMLGKISGDSPLAKYSSNISSLLDSSLSMSGDSIWAMQNVSNNPTDIDSWQNLSWTTQEVDAKLFPRPNKNNGIPFTEVDRVNKSRHELFEDSARTGTALAETRQATVKKAHDAVKQINHNSMQSKNLHDDLTVNNQAQVVMANELIQIRQLLAKQLELMAALHLKVYSEYSAPANLHRDKKEEAKKEQARIKRQQEFERELRQRIARVPTRL